MTYEQEQSIYNDHCLYNENQNVQRQVHWKEYNTGTMSYISGKAMDRFQCIWIAMIGEMYELIVAFRKWVQVETC